MECVKCGSAKVIKRGVMSNGKQRYGCKECGVTFRENPQPQGYDEARKEEIVRAYSERTSLRGLTRIFGVSRQTVTSWLKKSGGFASTGGDVASP